MSIYSRQYQKILASELLRYLMLGKLPDLNDISKRISAALDKNGNITYKYIPQEYKAVFNNTVYNKSLRSIKFDIDTLHEELFSMFVDSAKRINYADLYHKSNSYELGQLQAKLQSLLFTVKDADFYFDGAFDTFSDCSKLDSASSKDVIDLSEQCISLPFGSKNTKRIDPGTLVNKVSTSLSVSRTVLSNIQIPNTSFGSIFTDTLSVWGHEIITQDNGPLSITFTFPIKESSGVIPEQELFVSRFEIVPHSIDEQTIKITTSNDDVNYISIFGYEQGTRLTDQKKVYALDFETTLIQYIRVTLSKTEADEEIIDGSNKKYKYVFGLKKFASFQTGRFSKATYISKPFTFTSTESINKVSLDVDQYIPGGCNIFYYVAGVGSDGTESSYIPISPVGTGSTAISKIVSFNSNVLKSANFTCTTSGDDSPQVYGTSFQGKDFYRIGPVLKSTPLFGLSTLYRGYKSWARDSSGSFDLVNVSNTYVSFSRTDTEAIYTLYTETPTYINLGLDANNVSKTQLTLTYPPYYDDARGHSMKPSAGIIDPLADLQPNYAVYKVLQRPNTTARQTDLFTLTGPLSLLPGSYSFIIQSNDPSELPVITDGPLIPSGIVYREGIDYIFELENFGGRARPTGKVIIPAGSSLINSSGAVTNAELSFTYTVDPDVTHKVQSILGNKVLLFNSFVNASDSIEIVYRYVPTSPNTIVKSSVRVANVPSGSARTYYVEGRDYIIDPATGAIQRISTGTIPATKAVYVDYAYRTSSVDLQTFTTWAYVAATDGVQIKFELDPNNPRNKLVADLDAGESLYISTKQGLVNLTTATISPVIVQGWIQIIVRSKNPDTNANFRTNLIDQVIQLRDINRKKVFSPFGYYFNQITAYRDTLVERTLNHLKVNTLLSDHSNFAIDSTTDPFNSYIVLNFKPNETAELYSKVPTDDSDDTSPPATTNEDFLFTWSEKSNSSSSPKQVKVKIELVRNLDTDGAITPKLFKYQIRVGS